MDCHISDILELIAMSLHFGLGWNTMFQVGHLIGTITVLSLLLHTPV
jgi:hypothetical protein